MIEDLMNLNQSIRKPKVFISLVISFIIIITACQPTTPEPILQNDESTVQMLIEKATTSGLLEYIITNNPYEYDDLDHAKKVLSTLPEVDLRELLTKQNLSFDIYQSDLMKRNSDDKKPTTKDLDVEEKTETPTPIEEPIEEPIAKITVTGNEIVNFKGNFTPTIGFFITDTGLILTSSNIINNDGSDAIASGNGFPDTLTTIVGLNEKTETALVKTSIPGTYNPLAFFEPLPGIMLTSPGSEVIVMRSNCPSCPAGYLTSLPATILSQTTSNGIEIIKLNTSLDPTFNGAPILNAENKVIGMITSPIEGIGISNKSINLNKLKLGSMIYNPTLARDLNPNEIVISPFPMFFSGEAKLDGNPVPNDTVIYAKIGDYISQPVYTDQGLFSFLTIQAPNTDLLGESITFYVDGFLALESSIFQTSMDEPLTVLDLSSNPGSKS
tara:strand:+ start:503 stop:1825 length:1323 start_codon:yes stop_codon:yes gene_type:complete